MKETDRFEIEGETCFMNCPPGLEPRIQLYDLWLSGTKRYIIYLGPEIEDKSNAE